jgi:hypothetical protein
MTWTVRWSEVCEADVRRIPWPLAARICASVLEFAESGVGMVERTTPGDPSLLRVRVRGAAALVRLDAETRTLSVWRIYTTR